MIALVVVFVLALFGFFWVMGTYNSLVGARNETRNSFSQIDVQLKRRYDLIPNLVETAKGYMKHEAGTLEAVVQARNQAVAAQKAIQGNPSGDPAAMKSLLGAESALGSALGRMTVTMEQYPDLKANQNMSQLMEELSSTENKILLSSVRILASIVPPDGVCWRALSSKLSMARAMLSPSKTAVVSGASERSVTPDRSACSGRAG